MLPLLKYNMNFKETTERGSVYQLLPYLFDKIFAMKFKKKMAENFITKKKKK